MDRMRIDGHKLNHHPERVAQWLADGDVYPIYMEISPTGACNHRCVFCGLDFAGYRNDRLPLERAATLFPELAALGLKSVMFGGEGEPLLHPDMAAIGEHAKRAGIDVAFTTNGVLLTGENAEPLLRDSTWIKVSCNGGDEDTYRAIHRSRPGDFAATVANMTAAVKLRAARGYACTLGLQLVLLPENRDSVVSLARIAADIGVDYLVVKPFSQHNLSVNRQYEDLTYDGLDDLDAALRAFARDDFRIIFRRESMERWNERRKPYDRCLALPFWSYIDSAGNVWGCSVFLGAPEFNCGNIHEQSFAEIWKGERRRAVMRHVAERLDVHACRINCRMDAVNGYLWAMKHPPEHVNFI